MIVITAAIFGALLGGFNAARRKGNKKDIAQYATAYALAFMIVGMITTIVVHRILL
ncbi:apolipoprotein acyltransferase [Roseobacter sp.]|uniref:apolipoprotein acyltransferase n=1 Tax=Roseobacter sp. TaxID=1907202 RepID=UPI00329A3409